MTRRGRILVSSLGGNDFQPKMYADLAAAIRKRFHTAMLEGKSEQEAFEEIVHIILDCYREALAS